MNTKLLLLMPLIPPSYHRQIRLNHLRRSLNIEFLGAPEQNDDRDKQEFDYEQNAQIRRSKSRKKKVVYESNTPTMSHNTSRLGAGNNSSRIGGGNAISHNPGFDIDINMPPAVPSFND